METDARWLRRDGAGARALSDRAAGAARRLLRHGVRHPARGRVGALRAADRGRDAVGPRRAQDARRRGLPLRRAAPAAAGAGRRHRRARRADPLRRPLRPQGRRAARGDGRLQRRRLVGHRAAVQALRPLRRSAGRPRHLRELRRQPRPDPLRRSTSSIVTDDVAVAEFRPRAARRLGPLPGDRPRPGRPRAGGAAEPALAAARPRRRATGSTTGWSATAAGSRRSGPGERPRVSPLHPDRAPGSLGANARGRP